MSYDEADLTVLNWISAMPQLPSIILANDSDYAFFNILDDRRLYTISYSYYANKEIRRRTFKPWLVTDLGALHLTVSPVWPHAIQRFQAALIAGQDYTGAGLNGIGLLTLFKTKIVRNVSFLSVACHSVTLSLRQKD